MATYFQFWNLNASGKQNLKTRYSRSFFRKILRETYRQKRPSLSELFAIEVWNPDEMGPKANRHYALGESFVDFMLSSKPGRKVFKRTFQRITGGQTLFTPEEIKKLEPGWHAHIRKTLGLKR